MANIGSFAGFSGGGNQGSAGTNYQAGSAGFDPNAPGVSAIQNPVTAAQAATAYGQTQQGLAQQQAFVNALQSQGAQGMNTQSALTGMLMNQANGAGPNPAQAQLAQNTAANTANQAALMAGQRGAGANVGLMARQAAMQGGANQQNAVGQAATLQAQQSIAAQNQLQSLAGTQVGQQAGAINNYNSQAQSEQGNLLSGLGNQNTANVGMQSNINNANAGIANTTAQGQQALQGGFLNGLTSAPSMAQGGVIKKYDNGGPVTDGPNLGVLPSDNAQAGGPGLGVLPASNSTPFNLGVGTPAPTDLSSMAGPQSFIGKSSVASAAAPNIGTPGGGGADSGAAALQAAGSSIGGGAKSSMSGGGGGSSSGGGASSLMSMLPMLAMAANKGGKVPALVSPGEKYLTPEEAKKVAMGRVSVKSVGKEIPGQAKVNGDSLKNDTVPADLDEGGVVIPRSNRGSKEEAFVKACMQKQNTRKK